MEEDKVVDCATNFWVGNRLDFTPYWVPAVPGEASKAVQWSLDGKFVNTSSQRSHEIINPQGPPTVVYYGAVNYFKDPDLLRQENTGGWWVSGDFNPPAEYRARIAENLQFNNGQHIVAVAGGRFNMWRPKLIEQRMCQDLYNPVLTLEPPFQPCMFMHDATSLVQLGTVIGGYARFWASFQARPGDMFVETQIIKTYRQWGNNPPISSGADWWFDGEGNKPGGVPTAGADGIGIVQQTDKFPFIFKEAPEIHLVDTFRTYMRYTPQEANSISVTLVRVDWSWAVNGEFVNGEWSIAPGISEPSPQDDDSFPDWVADTPTIVIP